MTGAPVGFEFLVAQPEVLQDSLQRVTERPGVRELEQCDAARAQQATDLAHCQFRVRKMLQDVTKNDNVVFTAIRIVVFEKVRDDDVDTLISLDIASGRFGQLHTAHVPAIVFCEVQQAGASAANVHYRYRAVDPVSEEAPCLPRGTIGRVVDIVRADVCFGVLRLVYAAIDVIVPQSAIATAVILEITVTTIAQPERKAVTAAEATYFDHNRSVCLKSIALSYNKDVNSGYDLQRFVDAQAGVYEQVTKELAAGAKRSHWMWFVFPQLRGLGFSPTAKKYGISGLEEAEAYLSHRLLGVRLRECTELVLGIDGRSVHQIFAYPDDLKFHSSMTLFARVARDDTCFNGALAKFFSSERDGRTLELLR